MKICLQKKTITWLQQPDTGKAPSLSFRQQPSTPQNNATLEFVIPFNISGNYYGCNPIIHEALELVNCMVVRVDRFWCFMPQMKATDETISNMPVLD